MIRNVHERHLKADPKTVWSIVASLSSRHDELWPRERWPAMRFDGPLAGGARGGHGPVRYEVAQMRAPHSVAFRFTPDFGIRGEHRYEVEPRGEGAVLRHVLEGRPVGADALPLAALLSPPARRAHRGRARPRRGPCVRG